MSETITIHATTRDAKGKSAVNKLRAKGCIPAIVYGHNLSPLSLSLNTAEINKLFKAGREDTQEYRLYKLAIDTADESKGSMVIIKEIQRHPLNQIIRHIDFFAVRMDEKIIASVHIRIIGKSAGVKLGGILRHIVREIEVKSLPADIPPHFDVDVTELQIGDSIHVRDIRIPETLQIITDLDAPIVSVIAPIIQKEEEKPEAEAAEQAEPSADEKETKESKE